MKDIVIVEDKLKKGISLAQQFKELEKKRSDLEFKVTTVCYFKPNMEAAKEEIEKCGKQEFEVLPVSASVRTCTHSAAMISPAAAGTNIMLGRGLPASAGPGSSEEQHTLTVSRMPCLRRQMRRRLASGSPAVFSSSQMPSLDGSLRLAMPMLETNGIFRLVQYSIRSSFARRESMQSRTKSGCRASRPTAPPAASGMRLAWAGPWSRA